MSLSQGNKEYWISELGTMFNERIAAVLREQGTSLKELQAANADRITDELDLEPFDTRLRELEEELRMNKREEKLIERNQDIARRKLAGQILGLPPEEVSTYMHSYGDDTYNHAVTVRSKQNGETFEAFLRDENHNDILDLEQRKSKVARAIMLHTSGVALRDFLKPILAEFDLDLDEVMNPTQSPLG